MTMLRMKHFFAFAFASRKLWRDAWFVKRSGNRQGSGFRFMAILAAGCALTSQWSVVYAQNGSVASEKIADEKAVFATVESVNVLPARARIGGTIAARRVTEGMQVKAGQVLATIGDEKLVLQLKSLDAQIAGLEAQLSQAQTDFSRIEELTGRGTLPRTRLDEARTALNVAQNAMRARVAERAVVQQQLSEGDVLSPAAGRVLKVPVTVGAVVMPGEAIATIAQGNFVLRLRVPERHARFLKAGDSIRIDGAEIGQQGPRFGKIGLVYPLIEEGRVIADAEVDGLSDYFVGERIRVWIAGGARESIVISQRYVTTRFGIDYVRLKRNEKVVTVTIQRGRDAPTPKLPDGIEVLSGLVPSDELVLP